MPDSVYRHCSLVSVLTNVFEMCKFHNKLTSLSPFLSDATMSRQENCMMHMQASTNVNTAQTRFGSNRSSQGCNQGWNKHASKTQTVPGIAGWLRDGSEKGFSDEDSRRLEEPSLSPPPVGALPGQR